MATAAATVVAGPARDDFRRDLSPGTSCLVLMTPPVVPARATQWAADSGQVRRNEDPLNRAQGQVVRAVTEPRAAQGTANPE